MRGLLFLGPRQHMPASPRGSSGNRELFGVSICRRRKARGFRRSYRSTRPRRARKPLKWPRPPNQSPSMPFVVTENCIKCKYTDCVEVCPVDCFHEGPNFLVIDPDECIDCTLCEPECPINAIYPEDDVPAGQEHFVALNAELSPLWPVITVRKDAPADAKDWEGKPDKLPLLER